MGKLPDSFAGRPITGRVPHTMAASTVLQSGQKQFTFLSSLFTHNTDKPFEIHRVIFRAGPPTPKLVDYTGLELTLASVQIYDFTRDQNLLKVPTPLTNLVVGSTISAWEWAQPFYLTRAEGFNVTLDAAVFPGSIIERGGVRFDVAFQGALIIDKPATDRRG